MPGRSVRTGLSFPRSYMWIALMLLSQLMTTPLAQAKIPGKNDAKDSQGVAIQGRDVYVLPKGNTVFHGTINVFGEFAARAADSQGLEQGTWFGADQETSAAMGYKKACEPPKAPQSPKLLRVKTLKDFNLLLIPWGKEGHDQAAKLIGTRVRNPSRVLNGIGVTPASRQLLTDLCKTSVYVNSGGKIVAYSRTGGSFSGKICKVGTGIEKDPLELQVLGARQDVVRCEETQAQGAAIKLSGWRAPWDQNEIAICGAETTRETFQITPAVLELPLAMQGDQPNMDQTCDKKAARMRTSLVNQDRGAAFDIVFGDATFWPSVLSEGYISMSADANNYTVRFTNPEWAKFLATSNVAARLKDGNSPNVNCLIGEEICTVVNVSLPSGSSAGQAQIRTTGRSVKYGTNTKVAFSPAPVR